MKNPFKELKETKEVPKELKSKIMGTIDLTKAILEITELFSVNYIEALSSLFKTNYDSSQIKNVTDE